MRVSIQYLSSIIVRITAFRVYECVSICAYMWFFLYAMSRHKCKNKFKTFMVLCWLQVSCLFLHKSLLVQPCCSQNDCKIRLISLMWKERIKKERRRKIISCSVSESVASKWTFVFSAGSFNLCFSLRLLVAFCYFLFYHLFRLFL